MAFRLSTKVRDDMLGKKAACNALYYNAGGIALNDNGVDLDTITDTGSGLAIFEPGDMITVSGAATGGNDGDYEVVSAVAGTVEIATGSLAGTDAAGGSVVILGSARGGSLVDLFRNGTMKIFTGSQPTHADDAEAGSELIQITEGSGAFPGGAAANGINLGQVADCELHKALGEVWSGVAGATGTAGWFRIYDNALSTGAQTEKARVDGAIATSGSQMNMANTSITAVGTTTIDSVDIPMAESV